MKAIQAIFMLLLLTGCWDQRLVKDINLIYSQALDQTHDGKIETTIVTIGGGTQNQAQAGADVTTTPAILSAIGTTPRDSRIQLDRKVSGELYASKNRVTLLSRGLAEQNIYSMLDVHYRSPVSTTNARIGVVNGPAKDALHVKTPETPLISNYLGDLLQGLENTGNIPTTSLEDILSLLFDKGTDFVLPLLQVIDHHNVELHGVALFNQNKMSGELSADQTLRLLLLDHKQDKEPRLNIKVSDQYAIKANNYATVDVEDRKSNMKLTKNNAGQFQVDFDVELTLNVIEYPKDTLYIQENVDELNNRITAQLSKECEEVINIIQARNCDYYGIGKHMRAFYYSDWQKTNWKELYPKIPISVNLNTKILYHGIVN
ncbi:germination protein [Shouchella clausii]|uniref:Ger(x)C family spore germination protein n=1 Tax=Shouchella tritolerans TaxID=2979466 RepID=UPI001B26AEC5|nr:Ger(x)C family spore germination protein [Shouchella tritolerans]GIN12464.1 germination protein [Shouchella clausii]